jgi:hypothetical protein
LSCPEEWHGSLTHRVDGRGTGAVRKLSVSIPAYIRLSIRYRDVLKFEKEAVSYTTAESVIIMSLWFVLNRGQKPPGIHIADLTELYAVIVDHIMQKETIP